MEKFKIITNNGSEWWPDKAFEELHKILIIKLEKNHTILDSDNHVKNAAATKGPMKIVSAKPG